MTPLPPGVTIDYMETRPSVGIVTINYNSASFLGSFLDSLDVLDYPDAQLIVIDSASSDGSLQEIEARRPDATIIPLGENVGTAGGNNIGAGVCIERGLDFILFLNNDTTFEKDFLHHLVEAADNRTMVVPRILYSEDHRLISTHAGGFNWDLGLFRQTYHGKVDGPLTRKPRTLETASFCCLLMPTSVFREVGPLDERFFMYYEETDLLRRAHDRSHRLLYVPDAVVYHRESGSSGGGWQTPFKLYYATRNRPYLVRKHSRSRIRYALFTAYFWLTRVPYAVRYLAAGDRALFRSMVLGLADYYRGRMGRTRQVQDFA